MEKFKFSNFTKNLKIENKNEIYSGMIYIKNRFKNISSFLYRNYIYNKISVIK